MGYKPYPDYKTARLEWLDVLPKQWECLRLRMLSKRYSGGTPDKKNDLYWLDGTISWLNSGAVSQGTITKPSSLISEMGLKESSARWLPVNAVVIALAGQGKTKGAAAITGIEATFNQSMAAIVFDSDHPKFMYWWLHSQYKNIRGLASDDGRDGLNLEMIGSIPCPRPSFCEQLKISRFLDCKAEHIYLLIKKKKELIKKLQEQRVAVINEAVIRGFDGDAVMKNSGVKWLGKVPASWDVCRLRFLVDSIDQGWSPQCDAVPANDGEWGVLKVSCVNGNNLNVMENKALPSALAPKVEYEIKSGDILISRANTKGLLGSAALVPEDVRRKLILSDKLYRVIVSKGIDRKFLVYFLRSRVARYQYEAEATGASGSMQNIGQDTIGNLFVCLPPVEEQIFIVKKIQKKTEKIDNFIQKNLNLIELLQEQKTALITAAVTGQIDVRDWQPPEPSKTPVTDEETA